MFTGPLLPQGSGLACQRLTIHPDRILIELAVTSPYASCPVCARACARVHSHYTRTMADLPWCGIPVRLHVQVRRFFCDNGACPRRIFAERINELAEAYARKTCRLIGSLRNIGFECGGEGGSRLAAVLGMPASADTILDLVRRAPVPMAPTPQVLGVDDWAWRKGQRYGTILCDLERHQAIDLLPDRSAEGFSAWLIAHPGVQIVSRDRGGYYAQGGRAGASEAQQVADRFHLVHNLHGALKRMLDRYHSDLKEAARVLAVSASSPIQTVSPLPAIRPATEPFDSPVAEPLLSPAGLRRLEVYQHVRELHGQGVSQRQIAKQLDLDRQTVAKFVHADEFPQRTIRRMRYGKQIDRYAHDLARRWAEGCHNGRTLAKELQKQGFAGSYYMVMRYVRSWRASDDHAQATKQNPPAVAVSMPSNRAVAWMLLRNEPEREADDQAFLEVLWQRRPELKRASDLAVEFRHMLRDRRSEALEGWIEHTHEAGVPRELAGFADVLKHDYEAVKAAFSSVWSNGQVEGQVNRLKMIKRQMYGRAKFDLLRQRVLHTG
jgi:transposase